MDDISKAIIRAVGWWEDRYKLYLMISDTEYASPDELNKTIVSMNASRIVTLDDVATVSAEVSPAWTRVTVDGYDVVIDQVYQQPTGNTIGIASECERTVAEIRTRLPSDIQISKWTTKAT